jgi:hypothetical protein
MMAQRVSKSGYAAEIYLKSGEYYCVDSTGKGVANPSAALANTAGGDVTC